MTTTRTGWMPTDRPERYTKQLAGHWAPKTRQTESEGTTVLTFEGGSVVALRPEDGGLRVEVAVPEGEDLDRFADVVAEHLQRFGQREELQVTWSAQ
jgi:hypothetical protein